MWAQTISLQSTNLLVVKKMKSSIINKLPLNNNKGHKQSKHIYALVVHIKGYMVKSYKNAPQIFKCSLRHLLQPLVRLVRTLVSVYPVMTYYYQYRVYNIIGS